jgi:hypothetical protein
MKLNVLAKITRTRSKNGSNCIEISFIVVFQAYVHRGEGSTNAREQSQ